MGFRRYLSLQHLRPHLSRLLTTLKAGVILHYFCNYHYMISFPYGVSMVPTIASIDEAVLISRRHRRGRNVVVGDLVAFEDPGKLRFGLLKRVIGMPGDFVLRGSPDAAAEVGLAAPMIQVPEGHCWVAGDNQRHSRDSRIFGPVPLALIKGTVIARVYPSRNMGWFEGLQEIPEHGS